MAEQHYAEEECSDIHVLPPMNVRTRAQEVLDDIERHPLEDLPRDTAILIATAQFAISNLLASSPTAADLDKDAEIARLTKERDAALQHVQCLKLAALTQPMSDKKPWGDDYVPDDRPWTFPPNAEEVEAKEQAIHQAALALSESGHAADWNDAMIMAEVAVTAALTQGKD